MRPGEYILKSDEILCNAGKESVKIKVKNTGDRPIQVGSHYHFYETNSILEFDRQKAYGKRLDIPGGTSVRFEANQEKTIELIDIGGQRKVYGLKNSIDGNL
ncbi:urease subunit beta [Clostridium massiliamazoniense]|uniref:urease subunit beta n=1 Tax=Clostridium massiliamazoniense TaxID=1347366 RepID=UPI0006D78B06|nr:urease subunit beta [Clostridium massiliamazoniense]